MAEKGDSSNGMKRAKEHLSATLTRAQSKMAGLMKSSDLKKAADAAEGVKIKESGNKAKEIFGGVVHKVTPKAHEVGAKVKSSISSFIKKFQ